MINLNLALVEYRVLRPIRTQANNSVSSSQSTTKLFTNANPKSDYVPFYSILYRDHLTPSRLSEKTSNSFLDSGYYLKDYTNGDFVINSPLVKAIIFNGFKDLESKHGVPLETLLKDEANKHVVKELIRTSLNNYIYQEPDLSIQLHCGSISNISNNTIKNYLIYLHRPNFVITRNNENVSSVTGNFFFSTANEGILACLMVKRDDVPLIRARYLNTGVWDLSLLEFWIKKEYFNYITPTSSVEFDVPKENLVIVENFNNIFSFNKHKTISEKRAYLQKEEDELFKLIQEGVADYYKVIDDNQKKAKEEFSKFGFELLS